ncbi:MAG TPA: hybrid sensor histidine kinase/response regulator, partial [Bacteroidetes bacterium]|nr:hybrid sensor histidine kinase/response regulator [Bacteroidota bacterium]
MIPRYLLFSGVTEGLPVAGQTLKGTGLYSFPNSFWFYLIIIVLVVVAAIAWWLHHKKKKYLRQEEERQKTLVSLQQTLTYLTQNRENIIRERTRELEKELENLKQNLKSMEKTLQASKQSARRNSMLMTRISNTLRTNLNDILGFSSLLGNDFALNEETELFEYNENIRRSGEALMHLLNNIIDISKIESKSFSLNEASCDLTAITRSLIEQFRPAAETKGVHIVYKEEEIPLFAADNQAVKHILTNLIDNAVRYTEKGFIKISQSFNGKEIVWTIKDTGIGIDKAYLPDIFEPFRQQTLGYSKTTYQGAGLGLPLIKSMLNIMGGNIELESEKAAGTTVRVFFPYKKYIPRAESDSPKKQTAKKAAAANTSLKKEGKRILVLDEDRLESMLIKKILAGAEVIVYDNNFHPEEWTEKILSAGPLPDILMMDLDFSGKGRGTALLKKIREKFPQTMAVPA